VGYFGNVVELLACWKGHLGRYQYLVIWWLVPHCLMWCLKRERNARSFEGCERTIPALKLLFFHTLYKWVVSLSMFSVSFLVAVGFLYFKRFILIPHIVYS
jgi:hypothetical protein